MMELKNRIINYNENKEQVDKWLNLKGVVKYEKFANILEKNNIEITWKNLDDLVRYDKRLLINCFKYLSFYEDYLRALIWNLNKTSYDKLEQSFLKEIIDEVLKNENLLNNAIDFTCLKNNKKNINMLRNSVSHNKIILSIPNIKEVLNNFKDSLPKDYQTSFIDSINSCDKNLILSDKIKIHL